MKKITSLVVALLLVVGVAGALTASAATTAELQAMIAQLQAQLSALTGGSTSVGGTAFTQNLTVGSRGAEVSALQEVLNTEVDAGLPITGYFGGLTKAAVIKFQKANGISGTGYVGPLTRAALNDLQAPADNGNGTGSTVPGCAAGALFSATTGASCTTADNGNGTGNGTGTSLDGTDGTVQATQSSIAPTSQSMKKGDTKDIYGIRFTASAGKVTVNRIDVNFTDRPWLIFSQLVLKDTSGTVLATKTLTGPSDVTNVTEGSSYNVRFDNLAIVVTPGTDTNVVVSATVPSSNSFVGTSPYDATTASIPTGGIRTINGKGIYESTTVSGADVITLSSSGSVADFSFSQAPTSPLTGQVQVNSAGSDKVGVPLAIYRVRSTNRGATINTLVFTVQTDPGLGANLSTSMKSFKLSDGSQTYYGTLSGSTVTFTMTNGIVLTQDVVKDLTLSADITASTSAFTASTTIDISGTSAVDTNYESPTVGGTAIASASGDITGSNLTFTSNALTVSGVAVSADAGIVDNTVAQSATVVKFPVHYVFTLTNNSVNNLFVSKLPGDIVATTTLVASVNANVATTSITTISNLTAIAGDTTTAYVIPAGASRTFTLNGLIGKVTPATSTQTLAISAINYQTTAGTNVATVTAGIEGLTMLKNF